MKNTIVLAALLSALGTTPAQAARIVLTGVAQVEDGGGSFFAVLPVAWPDGGLLQGTRYTLSLEFSRPALSIFTKYQEEFCFISHDGTGSSDSDCYDQYYQVTSAENTRRAVGSFVTHSDFIDFTTNSEGFLTGLDEFYNIDAGYYDVQFSSLEPVNYRIVLFDSVPEPASWAMLIGGFGLVGGALRRRRHAPAG